MSLARTLFLLLAGLWLAASASAEPIVTARLTTELVSSRAAIAPGERFTIALRQRMNEGWHTYWRNPGDSGDPTRLTWTTPRGFTIGEMAFPAPQRLPFDILLNYGYSGEVLYPIEVTAPERLELGEPVTLTAHAIWLVCADVCVMEEGDLSITLPVASVGREDPQWAQRIAATQAALPARGSNVDARVTRVDGGVIATFAGGPLVLGASRVRAPHFFPYARSLIQYAAPENAQVGPRGVTLSLAPRARSNLGRAPVDGVLTVELRESGGWVRRAYEVRATPGPPLQGASGARAASSPANALSFPLAVLFALLGGLILNLMPCVFPVLSLKALSLTQSAHDGSARRGGVLFLTGVLVSFLTLAGVLIALRASGEALGWGFHLQSPALVASLAIVFFLIGLNLLGAFEIGGSLQNLGGGLAARGGDLGAFFTGVLAVVAATPCTAPFMASAIGAALASGPAFTLAVFAALAIGFAAPLVALSFLPGLQRILPKPGAWMIKLRTVLAFPMFATCAWLAWVLAAQTGPNGVLVLLGALLALSFLIVVGRWGMVWRIVGAASVALALVLGWGPISAPPPAAAETQVHEAWSAQRVDALRGQGRGVFVNFTAAWCVTCQVNDITSLNSPRVAAAFRDHNVAYLVGDWTNRDEAIAAELASHGRDGVPLYLYYAPGAAAPRILPQLLTERTIIDAVNAP